MKIDTKKVIKDYEGNDIINNDVDADGKVTKVPLTVRALLSAAVNNPIQGEIPTAEQKNKIYGISVKLYQGNEVDFTVDDRAFIKERAGKTALSPLLYGRLCDVLEEPEKEAGGTKAPENPAA